MAAKRSCAVLSTSAVYMKRENIRTLKMKTKAVLQVRTTQKLKHGVYPRAFAEEKQ